MKWYHPLACDNTVKNPMVCDHDNLEQHGYDAVHFKLGKIIEQWDGSIFFQAKKKKNDGDPDDALQNHLMLPIFSMALITQLNEASIGGVQYLPVRVMRPNGDSIEGFGIANMINFIEALDEEKSSFDRFPEDFPNPIVRGKIAAVMKYVLRREKLRGFDVIRLKDYKQAFFVSERFKHVFERNKFTGYSFREVELV